MRQERMTKEWMAFNYVFTRQQICAPYTAEQIIGGGNVDKLTCLIVDRL